MSKWMTAVFECDLRSFKDNPHHFDTPFGKPRILSIGNAFDPLEDAWQPIETAPMDGTEVLVFGPLRDGSGHYYESQRYYRDRWPVEWMDNCLAPTHWMPLPEPPK